MRKRLRLAFVPVPCADFELRVQATISLMADVFADRFIAEARAEVAARLGVPEEQVDRERHKDLPGFAELA